VPGVRRFHHPFAAPKNKGLMNNARALPWPILISLKLWSGDTESTTDGVAVRVLQPHESEGERVPQLGR